MSDDGRTPSLWASRRRGGDRGVPDGEHLARVRRGVGREAGTVPEMWPYYTTLRPDGRLSPGLRAEHVALSLYGLHQQSKDRSVHSPGTGLGDAVRQLKQGQRYSPEALDRRFVAAASAVTLSALAVHLRGLVQQLAAGHVGLDYDRLVRDLETWQQPDGPARVRRWWGSQYFAPRQGEDGSDSPARHNNRETPTSGAP